MLIRSSKYAMEALVVNLKDVGVEQLNPGLGIADMGLAVQQSELDFTAGG